MLRVKSYGLWIGEGLNSQPATLEITNPLSSIQLPASRPHPISSIQLPTTSYQHPASHIPHTAPRYQHPVSSIPHTAPRTPLSFLLLFLLQLLLILLSTCLLSCSQPKPKICFKDGRQYCLTSDKIQVITWDACYRRGVSCMEGQCYPYAIDELQQAIDLRPKDQRQVRAYGMHFREEYFPHRELGICYFHLGRIEDAMQELELSMSQTPSARAKYYLNQGRRSYLLENHLDTSAPVIHLEIPQIALAQRLSQGPSQKTSQMLSQGPSQKPSQKPSQGPSQGPSQKPSQKPSQEPSQEPSQKLTQEEYLTSQTPFQIRGTVLDDRYVASISVNQKPVFIELAEASIPFSLPVDLAQEGWNDVQVVARDLVDRQVQQSIRVYLDRQGPLVIGHSIRPAQAGGVKNGGERDEKEKDKEEKDGGGKDSGGRDGEGRGGEGKSGQVILTVVVYDRSGIDSFKLDQKETARAGLDQLCLIEQSITLTPGVESIPFWTQDRSGNITQGQLSLLPERRLKRLTTRPARVAHLVSPVRVSRMVSSERVDCLDRLAGEERVGRMDRLVSSERVDHLDHLAREERAIITISPAQPPDKGRFFIPPFCKGGLGGIFFTLPKISLYKGKIPLNPPLQKGDLKDLSRGFEFSHEKPTFISTQPPLPHGLPSSRGMGVLDHLDSSSGVTSLTRVAWNVSPEETCPTTWTTSSPLALAAENNPASFLLPLEGGGRVGVNMGMNMLSETEDIEVAKKAIAAEAVEAVGAVEENDIFFDITSPPDEHLTTHYQEIFLEGKIRTRKGIRKIELNGQQLFNASEIQFVVEKHMEELKQRLLEQQKDPERYVQLLREAVQSSNLYYLNQKIALAGEVTDLNLLVEDGLGNRGSRHYHIKKVPREEVLKSEQRMTLALLPFETAAADNAGRAVSAAKAARANKADKTDKAVEAAQENNSNRQLQSYINTKSLEAFICQGRFDLVERERLPSLLIEKAISGQAGQQPSQAGRSWGGETYQSDVAQKIGEMAAAEGVVCGYIQKREDGTEILARFVEVKTGIIRLYHDVFTPTESVESLDTITSGLAMKFRDSFPLCAGSIIARKGKTIQVDFGSEKGIFPGMIYNIFEDEQELLAKASIRDVREGSSDAEITEGAKGEGDKGTEISKRIRVGYRVRTR